MPVDTTEPVFARDTNYSSGSRVGQPTKNEPLDLGQGLVAGEPIPVDVINFALNKIIAWLADAGRGVYGDGSDGIVTITGGTTTLTRDMYYETLTITGTGVLQPAGHRVFVRGLLTIAAGGIIRRDGNAGSVPVDNVTGGAAGAALGVGSLGGSGAGGAGGNTSTAGSAGANVSNGVGGNGGVGGASNDTGADASEAGGAAGLSGGAGGAGTNGVRDLAAARGYIVAGSGTVALLQGGAGGGGGGGGDNGTGGGGGSGGGVLVIFAYQIANAGLISANGGAGGAAFTGPDAISNGGGAGGGGGLIYLVTRALTGAGTITVTGGAGGAGSVLGVASMIAPTVGAAGADGTIISLAA
jgi:hypothetical protein